LPAPAHGSELDHSEANRPPVSQANAPAAVADHLLT